jgi:hypothetical protein
VIFYLGKTVKKYIDDFFITFERVFKPFILYSAFLLFNFALEKLMGLDFTNISKDNFKIFILNNYKSISLFLILNFITISYANISFWTSMVKKEYPSFSDFFKYGNKYFFKAIPAYIINNSFSISIPLLFYMVENNKILSFLFFLYILSAFYLILKFMLWQPIMCSENKNAFISLKKSFELTSGHLFKLVLIIVMPSLFLYSFENAVTWEFLKYSFLIFNMLILPQFLEILKYFLYNKITEASKNETINQP